MSDEIKEQILPAESTQVKTDNKVRSIMMWASIAVAIIVIGTIAYIFGIRQPAIEAGNEAIGQADIEAILGSNDSTALAAYKEVAANHGGAAGNRASLAAACYLYQQGDYEEALKYADKFSTSDDVVGALAYALKGDCLVNLDRPAEALKAFEKGVKKADKNPQIVPYLLNKQAVVLASQGENAKAAAIYKEIVSEYPEFASTVNAEGRQLQNEALAEAGK